MEAVFKYWWSFNTDDILSTGKYRWSLNTDGHVDVDNFNPDWLQNQVSIVLTSLQYM